MTYFVFGKLHFSFRILGLNRKKHTAHFRFLKVETKFYIRWLEKSLIAVTLSASRIVFIIGFGDKRTEPAPATGAGHCC